jgi:plasmid maintenance system antidote protein VapI
MTDERKKVPATEGLVQLNKLLEGKKQKELSEELGIPQSVISEIVNRWRVPTLEQAVKFEKHGIASAAWLEEKKGAA